MTKILMKFVAVAALGLTSVGAGVIVNEKINEETSTSPVEEIKDDVPGVVEDKEKPEITIVSGTETTFSYEETSLPDFTTYFTVEDNRDGKIDVTKSMLGELPQQGVVGDYDLTLTVPDKAGNIALETITITVEDAIAPEVAVVSNLITKFETTDELPDFATYFEVNDGYDNTITVTKDMITGIPSEGEVGIHSLELVVSDASGNESTETIDIEIKVPKPTITVDTTEGTTFEFEEALPDFTTYFKVEDYYENPIIVTEDMLSDIPKEKVLGKYNLTVEVTDTYGAVIPETVEITIEDTTAPTITVEQDAYSVYKGQSMDWTNFLKITDNAGTDGLEVLVDSTNIDFDQDGTITIGTNVEIAIKWDKTIDFDTTGTYTMTITVTDESSNELTQKVEVEVFVNAPVLKGNMYPVVWNNSSWEVVDENSDWYDYNKKEWANVHITSEKLSVGSTVEESKLNLYVWIPRYKYNIPDAYLGTGTRGETNIVFEKGTESTGISKEKLVNEDENAGFFGDDYITHPAFTYGTEELTGFWMSKFEASGSITKIESRPNKTALTNLTIDEMYIGSKDQTTNLTYENIETGLIKAEEWGAAAYLSNSKYGINKEITINSKGITGYAGGTNKYNSENGINASTTGNINGIYDMSGGAYEYVSAINTNASTNDYYDNYKEILSEIDSKYVTKLEKGYTLKNTIGMAIYETKNYNDDDYSEVTETYPIIIKGGSYSQTKYAGAFTNHIYTGVSSSNAGFRITLRVTN